MKKEKYNIWEGHGSYNSRIALYRLVDDIDESGTVGSVPEKRPAVIAVPGGGFVILSQGEGVPIAEAYAGRGYRGFILHYATMSTVPDACGFDNMVDQLREAIDLVAKNADEWGVDPDKIILHGSSAGANLSAAYGSKWRELGGIKPMAILMSYPLLDHIGNREWTDAKRVDGDASEMFDLRDANIPIFGKSDPTEAELMHVSPYYEVNEDVPPTFIWHTMEDTLVWPVQSMEYIRKLYECGVPCEVHMFQPGDHALSLATRAVGCEDSLVNRNVSAWFDLAVNWLELQIDRQ